MKKIDKKDSLIDRAREKIVREREKEREREREREREGGREGDTYTQEIDRETGINIDI